MAPLIRHKQGIDATTSVDWVYGFYFHYDLPKPAIRTRTGHGGFRLSPGAGDTTKVQRYYVLYSSAGTQLRLLCIPEVQLHFASIRGNDWEDWVQLVYVWEFFQDGATF